MGSGLMRRPRSMTRRELVAGATISSLAACSRSRRSNSSVTVLYRFEPETVLGPDADTPAKFLVFTPLAAFNNRGELEGRLAEHWEHSPDFRTCMIRLRDGIRWHDGVPFTAHDMKFTLDLLQHPDTQQCAPGGYTVDVLNDRTYSVTYHRKDPYDDGAINDWTACWPKHLLEGLDPKQINSWEFWRHPIGCGPYRYIRTVPKTMMELEANPDYFRGKPKIERVVLKFGGGSAVPELLSCNVDAVCSPQRTDVSNISRSRGFRAHQQILPWSIYAVWWNLRPPFFQDALVRRALTCAIDRRELIQVLNLPENSYPIDFVRRGRQVLHSAFPEPNPYSPELAGQLLDQAGWRRRGKGLRQRGGRTFRFQALALGTQSEVAPAVYVQEQLKRIGVYMDIRPISDFSLVKSRVKSGEFEAAMADLGDWESEALLRGTGYDNRSFFDLLDRTRIVFDPGEKEGLHDELTHIVREDLPLTFLFPFAGTTIANTRLRGLDNSPYREDPTWCMDQLWLEEQI